MYKLFYIAAIVLFFSCQDKKAKADKEQATAMTEPSKTVIDSLVKDWYGQIPVRPGGSSHQIDSVQVLNMRKESQEDSIYHIMFVVAGTESNYSLQEPIHSNFSDTGMIDLVWKGSYWDVLNKRQRGSESY